MVPIPMAAPYGHGMAPYPMQRPPIPPTSIASNLQSESTPVSKAQQEKTSITNPSEKGKKPVSRPQRKRPANNETPQLSTKEKPNEKVKQTKIWSQRSAELSDEKLSKLVDDYLTERKLNTKVLKIEPSEKSTDSQTSTSRQPLTSKDVFMPRRVLDPPGEKRQMLENSVVALETGKEKKKDEDEGERVVPKKRRKSQ